MFIYYILQTGEFIFYVYLHRCRFLRNTLFNRLWHQSLLRTFSTRAFEYSNIESIRFSSIPEARSILMACAFVIKSAGLWASVFMHNGTPNLIASFATYPFESEWPFLEVISSATPFSFARRRSSSEIIPGCASISALA